MKTITFQEAVVSLTDIALARPEQLGVDADGTCRYFHFTQDGYQPSCIVGHLIGPLLEPLEEFPLDYNQEAVGTLIDDEVLLAGDSLHLRRLLLQVQGSQDDGVPWKQAVEDALTFSLRDDCLLPADLRDLVTAQLARLD